MQRTVDRIVTERVRLDSCGPEDDVRISFSRGASWCSIGRVLLRKVKPIGGGLLQVKYLGSIGGTVQKADLPADLVVERTRRAVEADGPDAGVPVRAGVVHQGVIYEATDPATDAAQLAERLESLAAARSAGGDQSMEILRRVGDRVDIGRLALVAALSVGCTPGLIDVLERSLSDDRS